MLATIALWLVLTALMVFPVKWLNTQNYTAHDTPDPKFTVIVLNEQGDRIEPISFVFHTLGDIFVQMILATVLYQIGKYGWTCWRLHSSPDELKMYHQMIVFNLKLLVLAIVIFVAIIWAVESR